MNLIYGFRNKAEAAAEEIKKLSDGATGQTKINKEDIATTTGQVNKLKLKYFSLKNGQYTLNAQVETNKTNIASLTAAKASKSSVLTVTNEQSAMNTKITNNKAEINTLGAGVSNLSNGTAGFVKKNKDAIAVNTADITALKNNTSTKGLATKVTALESKVGPAEIVKATGEFYVGNTQGTFKIEKFKYPIQS